MISDKIAHYHITNILQYNHVNVNYIVIISQALAIIHELNTTNYNYFMHLLFHFLTQNVLVGTIVLKKKKNELFRILALILSNSFI